MSIKLKGSTDGSVTLQAPADTSPTGTDKTFTLPTQDGEAGQILKTDGSGALSFTDNLASGRNLIINGDQRIDQRNNGSAVTTSSSFPVDRFLYSHSSNGAFSGQRSTEAPTGFQFSTKTTITTADTDITGSQRLLYFTKLEETNLAHLEFGTANAKTVTLSFWVRSSVTGTFSGSLQSGNVNRSYPYDYTINAADTWEYKTITIPGDTSANWATSNTVSHQVFWSLGISSSYAATAGAWTNGQKWGSTTGTANILNTLNATWYVTGVQLEVGENATSFEHRNYGDELVRCQRYYQTGKAWMIGFGSTNGFIGSSNNFNTTMRINNPNVVLSTPTENVNLSSVSAPAVHASGFRLYGTITTGSNINAYYTNNYTASAEL